MIKGKISQQEAVDDEVQKCVLNNNRPIMAKMKAGFDISIDCN